MYKILRIINRLNLGGPTYNAAYLSKHLSPEFETMLLSGIKEDSEESSEFIVTDMGLTPHYIPEMRREINFRQDRVAYRKIKDIIGEFKPDIVHTHASKAGTLGRLAAFHMNVPVVLHTFHGHVFHSYFSPLKTRIYIEIERYLARKSSAIIAISEKQKEELGNVFRICNPDKIEVVPLGFDLSRFSQDMENKRKKFRSEYAVEDDAIAIGIVGRIVPVKNHRLFLKGLKHVLDRTNKKIRAFIVGDGEDREQTEIMSREMGITFNDGKKNDGSVLTFTSWIRNVDEVYAGMDIVALTSRNEGTPVSIIEAQAASRPVVATRVGGIANIVQEGVSALLSESGNDEAFCSHLLQLVEDGKLRMKMSEVSADNAFRHDYRRLVIEMGMLYHKLLQNHESHKIR